MGGDRYVMLLLKVPGSGAWSKVGCPASFLREHHTGCFR